MNDNNRKPRACKKTKADEGEPSTSGVNEDKIETKRTRAVGKSKAKSKVESDSENAVVSTTVKRARGRPKAQSDAKDEVVPTVTKRTRGKPQTQKDVENEVVPTAIKRTRGKPQTQSEIEEEVVSNVVKRTKSRSKIVQETPISIPNIEQATQPLTKDEIEPAVSNIGKRSARIRGIKPPETFMELPPKTRKRAATPRIPKVQNDIPSKNLENLTCEHNIPPDTEYTDENQYDIQHIEPVTEVPQRKTRKKATTKGKKKTDKASETFIAEDNIPPPVELVDENQYEIPNVDQTEFGFQNVVEDEHAIQHADESPQMCPFEQKTTTFPDQIEDNVEYTDASSQMFPFEEEATTLIDQIEGDIKLLEEPDELGYETAEEELLDHNIFDQTMYNPDHVPQQEQYIPENRDYSADFNFDLSVSKMLEKQPGKSCLKRTSPKPQVHVVRSYKFFDEGGELKVVIDGISNSTFIKRVITYLQSLRNTFEMQAVQLLVPGINLEARLLGNLQMIQDAFRDELIPMFIYSMHKKYANMYHRVLMEQFRETINFFLNLTILKGDQYNYDNKREVFFFTDDPAYNTRFVNSLPRTKYSKFSENFYSFNVLLLYGLFSQRIHYTVAQEMFKSFSIVLQKAAIASLTID